jgi:glutathione S-transferase
MTITLRHHHFSRAANAVWMLEELGLPYELQFVDFKAGEHKGPEHKALNAMGKLPVLIDGEAVISETAAIGVYLADRYSPGTLAPALDDPARGPYLRWCFYGPSVVEPCCMAHASKWEYRPTAAGFGTYESLLETLEGGLAAGPWLLGERFTMADVILGGTVRWMVGFKMLEPLPVFTGYIERLSARPASVKAAEINARVVQERGLGT